MKITWNLPSSWKSHDDFYDLIYQVKYRPVMSSFHSEQVCIRLHTFEKHTKTLRRVTGTVCVCTQTHNVKDKRSFLITDAIPGEEYVIQVRTKEEYDGLWSNWSTAVHGCSWTGK